MQAAAKKPAAKKGVARRAKAAPPAKGHWSRSNRSEETVQLGKQLQTLRARHRWSLEDVARMSGISMSTLSRIENNKLSPTMDVISKLLNGLGIPYYELIIPARPRNHAGFALVTRAGHGEHIRFPGLAYEILDTSNTTSMLHAVILTVDAHSVAEMGNLSAHAGEEFLRVLSGELELHRYGYETIVLHTDDSIHFDSGVPHAYVARSKQPAQFLVVTNSPLDKGRRLVEGAGKHHVFGEERQG